jgi:hypothetical protein
MGDTGFNLYTNPRLTDFVNNFKKWYNTSVIGPNGSQVGGEYKYYHFVQSPDAIRLMDIGRIPFQDLNPKFFQTINSLNSNGNTSTYNTPLGWKMQLGEMCAELKNADATNTNNKVVPGLSYQIVQLPIQIPSTTSFSPGTSAGVITFQDLGIGETTGSKYSFFDYINKNTTNWVNLFSQVYEIGYLPPTPSPASAPSPAPSPASSATQPQLLIQKSINPITDITYAAVSSLAEKDLGLDSKFIGIEWYGYFKAPHIGNYSFSLDIGNSDYGLFWIGNKAVCEYVSTNADIISNSSKFTQTILDSGYIPIRLQYFACKTTQNPRKFAIKITDNDSAVDLKTSECLFTIDNGKYFPRFVYSAFTSSNLDFFQNGKFNCYSFGGLNTTNYNEFYSYMKNNKRDIFAGVYNAENRLGASIQDYGTLLNGVNYTEAKSPTDPTPNKLSVYRIYTDSRMGKNYQIDVGNSKNGQYTMRELAPNLVQQNNEYTAFPDYYPPLDFTKPIQKDVTACAADCSNNPNCNFYYSYSSAEGNPYCAIGTKYAKPVFNQIPGDNQTNGSLFLRENKLSKPSVAECIAKTTGSDYSKIINTTAYDTSNPYYNYTISDYN